ncbi:MULTISPECIES: 7-carboxy-7-deazaguanine synthase QueE [unclassified Rhizobium]|uniref:7-carboxy-7-deazaguanine synthase QueE n=1 Tax=unclassified Rhizobium TaxID=2613769 RepID=UPI000648552C|nr:MULTISPECIES: 7-carboxy-7-deazaguanine synthase QueE [unclassified Rhizobium]MBN8954654.1 7-carboxy-7-deazaguanine synthase QueE [Rhizobium tropici]OJY70661.1 MAG: 7-carboxy-7-deazaguanine synthase QueE [Rhizobium sp. 60-20]RKD52133.1 preQ(0) biosynthesis protein QueE [Rhizobium sp. WW_1]
MSDARIRVSEIFGPTIQGEGILIGLPTIFVRTGGCDYRCSWCDTLHAVDSDYRDQWRPMSVDQIWREVTRLSGGKPLTVSLSGGNPAIQPLAPLIARGHAEGYRFALETQGSLAREWFGALDVLVLSPKPPSSGMATDWAAFDDCLRMAGDGPQIALKIVIFDDLDYAYAREAASRYPQLPLYLQPGNHTPPPADAEDASVDIDGIVERMRWLVERVSDDRWFEARVLPQLHVIVWGNRRGV